MGGTVAESGDLGYTYGTARVGTESTEYSYLHIWRGHGAGWTLVVDLLIPN